ncbi:enoyl-CoA hydratase-related protein [Nocardia sp. NPDC049707]|uniref:enoyl-CoA hydratase/isomerase family protein n=1 Tax=Nocardia sp. NPDC049707 TaxID=3154735 RepID=UPI003414276C
MRHAVDAVLAIREIPQPVVAAVRGHAVGAGFALAAACDMRVCSPNARFEAPFIALGVSAGDLGLSWMLPRMIGFGRATELFYSGGGLDAETAADLGFVQQIAADPVTEALSIARAIATRPPLGVQMTKELLDMSLRSGNLREHLELEMRSQVIGLSSADHATAVAEFADRKRAANP